MQKKIALIIGATSGIGEAYAKKYGEKGYDLILTGRRKEVIEKKADKLKKEYKVNVDIHLVELSNNDQVEKFIKEISDKEINVLINNAGFGNNKNYHQENFANWEMMLDVHVRVPMKLAYVVLPNMIKNKEGTIINLSSILAFLPIPRNSIYCSTKSFMKVFSETLNLELKDSKVKIQVLCPGFTKSDFHQKMKIDKSKRKNVNWMLAEDVVNISLKYLKKNKVICIPGFKNKLIVFLLKLLPKTIYNKIASNFK